MTDSAGVLEGWLAPAAGAARRGSAASRGEEGTGADAGGAGEAVSAGTADEISKKELLELTGLSYGQLYRWKRMGLIPEHWFLHRATFTGQETFFPRRLILERIETIQRLKDRYSLEEIAKALSPAASGRRYAADEVERLNLCPAEGLNVVAAAYASAGRPKRALKPELQALLDPVVVPEPESQRKLESRPKLEPGPEPKDEPAPARPVRGLGPASYSFVDLVAGRLAVELQGRGMPAPAVQGAVETFLAGASQFSTLDDVHVVCAETVEPRARFAALYGGLEPVVFGHGVNVMADVAVGPIAESLRQSLQARLDGSRLER